MSITTRDLKLREKETQKNLNETYSTLRKQPVGGLGAMIQKPNQNEPPIKRTPTIFTPSPMLSSLPYLAEWVKYRSNEVAINTTAHLIRQREAAKASIIYDDMKQNELDIRTDKVLETVSRNFAPSTADLLRKYLSDEIDKSRNEERKIQEQRMRRVDLELNPVRPAEPAPPAINLPRLTRGDMGRPNEPTQADLREVRTTFYQKEPLEEGEEKLNEKADKFRQSRAVRKMKEFAVQQRPIKAEIESQIRSQNFNASEMAEHLRRNANQALQGYEGIRYSSIYPTTPKATIEKALARYESKRTARGFKSFIDREEEPGQEYKVGRTKGAVKVAGGGGGGGGAVVGDLRAEVMGRLAKGVV